MMRRQEKILQFKILKKTFYAQYVYVLTISFKLKFASPVIYPIIVCLLPDPNRCLHLHFLCEI